MTFWVRIVIPKVSPVESLLCMLGSPYLVHPLATHAQLDAGEESM